MVRKSNESPENRAAGAPGGGVGRRPRGHGTDPIEFRVGHHELVIRRRYEVLSIINDLMIGVWFAVGSILFFSEATTYTGTWLFLIGSLQLFIRPIIRLVRNTHLQRISDSPSGALMGTSHDF